jgi:hypothetical protein
MIRIVLAAAAAFALTTAAPAFAGCKDCKDCPQHKVAAADKAEKKGEGDAKVGCPCGKGEDCKCGANCECPHCHAKKAEKKEEPKKS